MVVLATFSIHVNSSAVLCIATHAVKSDVQVSVVMIFLNNFIFASNNFYLITVTSLVPVESAINALAIHTDVVENQVFHIFQCHLMFCLGHRYVSKH